MLKPIKIDFGGRISWNELTARVWLKDGIMRDLGRITMAQSEGLARKFGLELLVNPPKSRQILPIFPKGENYHVVK